MGLMIEAAEIAEHFLWLDPAASQKLSREKIREIRQPYWICSPAPAKRDFGFEPEMDLEHAMAETIRWYRENGHLPL